MELKPVTKKVGRAPARPTRQFGAGDPAS